MCCLVLVFALLGPRATFILWWIFGTEVERAFDNSFPWMLGAAVFAPWTGLAYTIAWSPIGGVSGIGILFVVLGAFLDLATWTGGARQQGLGRTSQPV